MKSPLSITYKDLLTEQENTLAWMKKNYPAKVQSGQLNEYAAKRKLAIQEQLVKLLRAHQKNRQLNLNEIFNQ